MDIDVGLGTTVCIQVRVVNGSGSSPLVPQAPLCATAVAAPPPVSPPAITGISSYREGQLVLAHVVFADPDNDAAGFGFRGINGTGFAQETHPFSNPSYGRVGPNYVDYPFNLGCGTGSQYEADLEFWIYDAAGHESQHAPKHLVC